MQVVRSRAARGVTAAMVTAALALSGCQTTGGALQATYVNDGDPCSAFRQPLVDSQTYFARSLIAGGVAGAALGALVAVATGGDNLGRRAALGALIGGATGLLGGYLNAKIREANDKEDLRAAIYSDAENDGASLTRLGGAVRSLNTCRSKQIANIRADYQANGDKDAARARLDEVRDAIAKDSELIGAVLEDANERNLVYAQAAAKTDEVEDDIIYGDVASYEPVVRTRPAAGSRDEPVAQVQASRRPQTTNPIQASEVQLREISAEQEAADAELAADIEALAVVLA